jgi:hypothetical protein
MDCQHCGKKVSIIRALTDSQYCCEDHRWTHLQEMNRLGLALLMGRGETSEQRELSTESSTAPSLFTSSHTPADAGSRDSTESACFRIGARVIQPPVIV